jgi:excisionase family DNA binding protein
MDSARRSFNERYQELAKKFDEVSCLFKMILDHPMTFKDTCDYLRISVSYLYKLCYSNRIPFHKPAGKILYFYRSEIDEWICEGSKYQSRGIKLKRLNYPGHNS